MSTSDFAGLLGGGRDLALLLDPRGRIVAANAAAEARLGADLAGRALAELCDAAPEAERFRGALRFRGGDGRPFTAEAWIFPCADGRILAAFPLPPGEEGRPSLEALVDSLGVPVWTFGRDGRILTWSAACEAVFGFTRAEAEGQLDVERLFARPEELRAARARVESEGRFAGDAALATKGGEARTHLLTMTRLGPEDAPLGAACVAVDVEDRAREAELSRSYFERVGEGLMVVDSRTQAILDANERASEMLGYSKEELLRLRIPDLVPPGDRPRVSTVGRSLAESGAFHGVAEPYRRKDGSIVLCEHKLRLIEVAGRRVVLGTLRDMTAEIGAERELREAKAFLERLREEARDGFALVDEAGRVVWANRALAEFRGEPKEAVVGTPLLDVEGLRKLRRGEAARTMIGERTVDVRGVPLESGGRPVLFATLRDVSEQARAEEELRRRVEERTADLRRSEERFRLIAELMPVAMATTRMDGTIVYVNEAGASVMRVPRAELPGRNIGEFYADPAERPKLREALLRDRAVSNWEFRLRRGDGSLGWGLTSLRIGEWGGEPVVFGCFQDLSALKSAEEALRLSESRFRTAFENLGIAACLSAPDGRFLQVNPALCAMLGYSEEELLVRGWKELTHPDDLGQGLEALRRLMAGELSTARFEKRYLSKSGAVVWAIVTTSLLRDAEGRPVHFVTGIQDITEMKRAETALQDAHDALERRVEERTSLLSDEIAQRRRVEENLKLYREIFRHAPEAVVVLDREGRALERNDAHRRLVGGTGEPAAARFARIREALEASGVYEEETEDVDASGRPVDLALSAFTVKGARGETLCHVLTLRDVTSRKRRERSLRRILEGTAAVTGETYFRSLARALCEALGVKAAFVTRVLDRAAGRTRTLASWVAGAPGPEREIWTGDAPCDRVLRGEVASHPSGVRTLYPKSEVLRELGAEGYIGVPIVDPGGEVGGLLAIAHDREIEDPDYATSLLRLFAGRAAAERVRQRAEEALRESEERWRSLVAHIPSFVMTVDRSLRVRSINRVVSGLELESVQGQDLLDFVAPEGRDVVLRALEGVFATGKPTEYQVQAVGAGGTLAWYETRVGPIVSGGAVVGATLLATDISARRETERKLAELAEEQSLVLSQSRDFLYRHDAKGVFTYISAAVEAITGRTPEEWRTHYTEYMTENPINRKVVEYTEETLRTGRQSPAYLVEVRHKDGRPVLLEVNERAYYEDGRIAGIIGVARDVTERAKAEEVLRFQRSLLQSQSEAAIDGILVVSMEGRMISFNRRFVEMWDIPPEVLESRDDLAAQRSVLGKLADPEAFQARIRYLMDHAEEESHDELALRDGRVFERYSAPIRSPEGTLYGRVWYFRDISGRKKTEIELRRAAEETRKAYDDLRSAQAQLIRSEKLASIGMLVSGLAHEINNPLNVMYGNLQLLAEAAAELPRRTRNMLRDALKAGEHARRVMDDFRGYARDARMAEPVDLNRCLEEAVSLLKPGFRRKVKVVKRLGKIPPVRCFRGQMSQVFLNLLKNAAEAVDKRGTVTLRTRQRAGRVIVEVEDTGRGMSEETLARLFEPFFTTKPPGKGLGLGLSISAMILQSHGGSIRAKSRPGKGSVFRVEIPVGGA